MIPFSHKKIPAVTVTGRDFFMIYILSQNALLTPITHLNCT